STVDIYVQFPESDGVSITAMEAMSSGLPIISSDVGDVPTLVKDGENGFLVDPNSTDALTQAIRKLLQNTQLQEKMGKESRDEAVTNHDRTKFFGSIAQRMKTIASNVS
ncbi:MAG: glycosyltransferase family 4 protein, partial [Candidatus Thorarchaeota archaeon]|nr:glycosyltransferase family 4 protein [Candidatus Thorarchaeota archaeon]